MTASAIRQSTNQATGVPHATRYGHALSVVAFSIAMIIALAVAQPIVEKSDILLPALVISVFSLYSFFLCGQRTVNASSVASYGVLMFIGFPASFGALDMYDSDQGYTAGSLTIVVVLAFLFQGGLLFLAGWTSQEAQGREFLQRLSDNPAVLSRVFRLSLMLFLLSLLSKAVGAGTAAAGFSWVSMLGGTIVAFWSFEMLARLRGIVLVAATFVTETGLSLGSFGRLNLAVLALSLVVIASLRKNSWTPKVVTAVLTGPILVYLVNQRLAYLQSEREGGLVYESEGLGSVVGPFHSAGTIVEAIKQGRVPLAWGETLFNAAVTGVPRAFWPEKPVGFGREIVEVTQPWMVSIKGYSDAGTFIGEAVWNFGIWLAPLYLVAFIMFIRMLDRKLGSFFHRRPDFSTFIILMLVSMATGTLLNVIWGSSSTAAARTLFPLALLLLLWFWATKVSSRRAR